MVEVNGQLYQHVNVKPRATSSGSTFPFSTHKSLKYNFKLTKKASNRADGSIDGRTVQNAEIEASITMKLAEALAFAEWLLEQDAAADPANKKGVLQIAFDLPVSWGSNANALVTDTLVSVMLQEWPRASEDNQDPSVCEIPLSVLDIQYAGGLHPAAVFTP